MKEQITRLYLFSLIVLFCMASMSTKVQAQEYDEVSYDDLINQINKKRSRAALNEASVLDDITLHAGFGLITSSMNVQEPTRMIQLQMTGFQMSFGIDLFSPNLVAEGAIRNFGSDNEGSESHSYRELDMKVFYHLPSTGKNLGFRLGTGLATQYLTLADAGGVNIDESSPAAIVFAAIEANPSKNFGIGAEAGYRSALLNNSADRSSMDLMIRLDGYF